MAGLSTSRSSTTSGGPYSLVECRFHRLPPAYVQCKFTAGRLDVQRKSVKDHGQRQRTPLSRDRILRAAMKLADEGGIKAVSMRKIAQELGVEAMSLYNHVASKDDIIDGIVDLVATEIDLAPDERRLEGGHAPAGDLGARGAPPASVGGEPLDVGADVRRRAHALRGRGAPRLSGRAASRRS